MNDKVKNKLDQKFKETQFLGLNDYGREIVRKFMKETIDILDEEIEECCSIIQKMNIENNDLYQKLTKERNRREQLELDNKILSDANLNLAKMARAVGNPLLNEHREL